MKKQPVSSLQNRSGIAYEVNVEQEFTGKFLKKYESGKKEVELNFKDGKVNGLATIWHENGQKKYEGNYQNNKAYGLWTFWYKNGQKEDEGNYKDDKQHGLVTFWHENGQERAKIDFKDGKPHNWIDSWDENGQKDDRDWKKDKDFDPFIFWSEKKNTIIEMNI